MNKVYVVFDEWQYDGGMVILGVYLEEADAIQHVIDERNSNDSFVGNSRENRMAAINYRDFRVS